MIIQLKSFTNDAASRTKGLQLKTKLEHAIKEERNISVDFDGIARFASPFFNNSFASLALIYGFDAIRGISKLNLSETGNLAFTTSIENAQLLSANPDYTDQIKDIINQNLPKKED